MKGFPDNIHRVKIRSILIILLLYAYNYKHLKFKEISAKLFGKIHVPAIHLCSEHPSRTLTAYQHIHLLNAFGLTFSPDQSFNHK